MHFYLVILAMFKFTVIMPITAKVETVLRLLGTYKIILKRKNHRNTMFQFYYIGDDFLVLRESGIKLKLLCTAWKIVQCKMWLSLKCAPPVFTQAVLHQQVERKNLCSPCLLHHKKVFFHPFPLSLTCV